MRTGKASLGAFQWDWPKKINRPQIQNIFRLAFIEKNANAVFLGGVGGISHLAIALGHTACLKGYSVLFTTGSAWDRLYHVGIAQIGKPQIHAH
ncbi:MAG: ATP-binding protein, partial [Gammaproteobacteria bacterium]